MTDVSSSPRAKSLLNELAAARAEAVEWDYDLPSELAYARAESILHFLSCGSIPVSRIESAIAVDGAIEIDVTPAAVSFVVLISPDGQSISSGAIDYGQSKVVESPVERTEAEVVQRIEQSVAA